MILIFILLIILNIIFNLNNLMNCIYNSLNLWFHNVFPSIFIFYNIGSYLYLNNFFNFISLILKAIIKFDCKKSYSLLLINVFLGNPGTTNLINNAYDNNEISYNDFLKLNDVCIFINPLFVLVFFNLQIYILYFCSIIIFIVLYGLIIKNSDINTSNYNTINYKYTFNSFFSSINNVINILLNVACLIVFFNILKNTIVFILNVININCSFINILLSFLEVSSGIHDNYHNMFFAIIILFSQGLCILLQSFSIISKKNISFSRYILNHILSTIITSSIFILLNYLFHI